jgi:hypothetical protein
MPGESGYLWWFHDNRENAAQQKERNAIYMMGISVQNVAIHTISNSLSVDSALNGASKS